MPNNSSPNDPQDLWQGQETEEITMSTRDMRDTLEKLRRRGRVGNLMMAVIMTVITIGYGSEAAAADTLVPRIGYMLMSFGSLYWAILLLISARSQPREAIPEAPSMDLYRHSLERSLTRLRIFNRRVLGGAVPIVIGVVMVVWARPRQPFQVPWRDAAKRLLFGIGLPSWLIPWVPFLVLLALWAGLVAYLRMCSTGWLKSELHRIDRMRDQ